MAEDVVGLQIDDSGWPVVVARVGAQIDPGTARAFNARLTEYLARNQPFWMITDLTHMTVMPLSVLQALHDGVNPLRKEMERLCSRGCLVTPNPVIRAIGRAAQVFLSRQPRPRWRRS